METRQPAALDWVVLLLLGAVWGFSFIVIKRSVAIFSPVQMSMWRMVLALAVYLPIALVYWSKIDWKRWKYLAIVAFCGSAIPNFLFGVAQQHVDSSLAGVLNSLTPLFTLILGVSFFQMKLTPYKVAGVLLGLVGATMLIFFNSGHSTSGENNAFFAGLCALATVCYAINANVVSRYLSDQHPASIASAAFVITGGLFVIGLWYSGGWEVANSHPEGFKGVGYIFYLASVGTVLGSIVYFWLMQRTTAVFATSVTYLLPVMAMIIGSFDGEKIGLVDMGGTSLILAALYLAKR